MSDHFDHVQAVPGAALVEAVERASVLFSEGDARAALAILDPLQHDRSMPALHNLLGMVRAHLGDLEGAQSALELTRAMVPANPVVLCNLASIYGRRKWWPEAETIFKEVLSADPESRPALLNYSWMLHESGRTREGIRLAKKLRELDPENASALFNLACMHRHLQDLDETIALCKEVLRLDPGHVGALDNTVLLRHFISGQDPGEIAEAARSHADVLERQADELRRTAWPSTPEPERRLRIGLVSADLRDHPVGFFVEGLLAHSASQPVDWISFHNTDEITPLTKRVMPFFLRWHETSSWSDRELCEAVLNERIDVLVDLSGRTRSNRLGAFAAKPAPLQLTWLGYYSTTGLRSIDGVIADAHSVPPEEEIWFSERVLRMPEIRYCFTPAHDAPEVAPLPALHRGHVTFGSFQQLTKLNDEVLGTWGRIARAVRQARWRIQCEPMGREEDAAEFRDRLKRHGFDLRQVTLSGSMPRRDYLSAHAEVDFLLDTFPYPGGTTISEALWMGVPSLVLEKPGMLGRQGAAINRVVGLEDWISHDVDTYIERALHWADPVQWPRLAELRRSLRERVLKTPLFDQVRFADGWHALVRQAWRDACARGWPVAPLPQAGLALDPGTRIAESGQKPEDFATPYERAAALYRKGEYRQLQTLFDAMDEASLQQPDMCLLRGMLARLQERYEVAEHCFRKLLAANPDDVAAAAELALLSRKRGKPEEAVEKFRKLLQTHPEYVIAHLNLGLCLMDLGQIDEAIDSFQTALQLSPNNLQAMFNIALAHQLALRMEEACVAYETALIAYPQATNLMANLMFARHYLMPAHPDKISERARQLGKQMSANSGRVAQRQWLISVDPDKRLRVGLLTGDLRHHPVGFFMEGLLREAPSREVDWVAYHNSELKTALTHRIRAHFLEWRDVKMWSDEEIVDQIVRDRIDVLIDLSGFTTTHRLEVFAHRPAPLQLTWLGYFGTTGLDCFDAIIADPHSVPHSEEGWYAEPVARLPHTRLNMAPPANAPDVSPLPAMQNGFVTFGCFQNMAKINDAVLAVWGRIASELPRARFRIQNAQVGTPRLLAKFRDRLAAVGLTPDRVECLPFTTHDLYFNAYAEVDLVLDTFCYPGGTTTAEGLWMGVPTITYATPGMLGRQGEMLLSAAGMGDWVTRNTQAYIAKAVHWAQPQQREALATLRLGMRERVRKTPLFDSSGFARDWHGLIRDLWRKACGKAWSPTAG